MPSPAVASVASRATLPRQRQRVCRAELANDAMQPEPSAPGQAGGAAGNWLWNQLKRLFRRPVRWEKSIRRAVKMPCSTPAASVLTVLGSASVRSAPHEFLFMLTQIHRAL